MIGKTNSLFVSVLLLLDGFPYSMPRTFLRGPFIITSFYKILEVFDLGPYAVQHFYYFLQNIVLTRASFLNRLELVLYLFDSLVRNADSRFA